MVEYQVRSKLVVKIFEIPDEQCQRIMSIVHKVLFYSERVRRLYWIISRVHNSKIRLRTIVLNKEGSDIAFLVGWFMKIPLAAVWRTNWVAGKTIWRLL